METTYHQTALGGASLSPPAAPTVPPVSIGVFMDRLERQGVTFAMVGDELRVAVPLGALSEAERGELVARRDEVEALVCVALGPYQPAVTPSQPTQTTWEAA